MSRFGTLNAQFYNTVEHLMEAGMETAPRGMKVKEELSAWINLDDARDRVIGYEARNVSKRYLLAELIWYLSGSNTIEMIQEYAKFWTFIVNEDNTVNSAYGNRMFGHWPHIPYNQWDKIIEILKKDPDSRQAILHINHPHDYTYDNKDTPCTLSLQFFIRDNKLHMIVNMRSNDIILGFTNDVFQFTMLQEYMQLELKKEFPGLELGTYYHNAGSMHIYERHFEMAENIMAEVYPDTVDNCPTPISMRPMEMSDTDIENLIRVEEIWRTEGKQTGYDFTRIEAYNNLSQYWKDLIQVCFNDEPWSLICDENENSNGA